MKKTIGIIGVGRFGLNLVESFSKNNVELLVIDHNKERAEKAGLITPYVVVSDSTDLDSLKKTGIETCDHVIVALGQDDETNIATTIMTVIRLKTLGIKRITVRVDDDSLTEAMTLVGATDIISPLKIASDKIANKLSSDSVIDYYNVTDEFDAYQIALKEDFKGLAILELNSRTKYIINILLVKRNGKYLIPNRETTLEARDELIIFGKKKDINKIIAFFDTFV